MIDSTQLTEVAVATRTHGTRGEIQTDCFTDAAFFTPGRCLIADIDGINVPFFISGVRPKGAMLLLKFEDVDSAEDAKGFTGKTLYALTSELPEITGDSPGEIQIDDLKGFSVVDSAAGYVGCVSHVEYSTANALLILETPDNSDLYIPAAEGIIDEVDIPGHTIHVSLPDGLLELNR